MYFKQLLLYTKYILSLVILLSICTISKSQVEIGISVGTNFENLLTGDDGGAWAVNNQYGNIGLQLGVNSALKLNNNSKLTLEINYIPKKEVPYIIPSFLDFVENYSYHNVIASVKYLYNFNDFSFGIGPSFSEIFNRKLKYNKEGWIPKKGCSMIGGVISTAYSYDNFFIKGSYRILMHPNVLLSCSGVLGVYSFDLSLGYFLNKQKIHSRKK